MMASVIFIPKLTKAEDPLKRLPYLMGGMFLAFVIGAIALFAYHALAPHSFVWFSLVAIASFFISIAIWAVPQFRQLNVESK